MKPRTALIIVENLSVPFDRRVWQEAQALQRSGFHVRVICPRSRQDSRWTENLSGIDIWRYPSPVEGRKTGTLLIEFANALMWITVLCLLARIRTRIDVAHICNPPDLLFLPGLVLRAFGAALIFDHHDVSPELMVAKGFSKASWQYRVTRLLERWTFRACNVSIATNESYREIALTRGRMAGQDVFVVRSGPDDARFSNTSRKPIPIVADAIVSGAMIIAYVGVLGHQEGVADLLEVARIIHEDERRKDIAFVIAGAGPELNSLKRTVAETGLDEYVFLLGRIGEEELAYLLSVASVCVNPDLPSVMNDISTMNKIMEYMAFAKPIVQYDLKEGRFSAADSSLYARPGDKRQFADLVLELCDDQTEARRRGAAGKQRYESLLHWRHQEPQLLSAYKRALDKQADCNRES
jgi:glycosyltransferase involved in cell wall biosynthesis